MRILFSYIFLLLAHLVSAQVAERPTPQRLYNNLSKEFPDFLNAQQAAAIEEKLEQFSNQTSNQICVVVVDDLNGMDAAEYATKLINEWGIGKKELNNGVVILIKPTGGSGQRDLFIGVGYGLEGAIPDLATKRVREEEMYPYMKQGDYYTAIDRATDRLMQLAKGEINVVDYTRNSNKKQKGVYWPIIIIVIIIMIIRGFRGGGGSTFSRGGRTIFWGGGGFGGGRGFGGGGGGGWGGFGGGSSGGGGSGGKW